MKLLDWFITNAFVIIAACIIIIVINTITVIVVGMTGFSAMLYTLTGIIGFVTTFVYTVHRPK